MARARKEPREALEEDLSRLREARRQHRGRGSRTWGYLEAGIDLLKSELEAREELETDTLCIGERPVRELDKEILRVLPEQGQQGLRQGQVHERLLLKKKPGPRRIGQVLTELEKAGFCLFKEHPYRRGPTRYYRLSTKGLQARQALFRSPNTARPATPAPATRCFLPDDPGWRVHLGERPDQDTPQSLSFVRRPILAFHSLRDSAWQARLVSAIAHRMARSFAVGKVVVIDLALDAPALDAHLAFSPPGHEGQARLRAGLQGVRGLAGLWQDWLAAPRTARPQFMREALADQRYLGPCDPVGPADLYYLPTGLAQVRDPTAPQAAELAAGLLSPLGQTFLDHLHSAIWVFVEGKDRLPHGGALVHAPSGLGRLAWSASVGLANGLVACIKPDEPWLEGHQAAFGSFLQGKRCYLRDPDPPLSLILGPVSPGSVDTHHLAPFFPGEKSAPSLDPRVPNRHLVLLEQGEVPATPWSARDRRPRESSGLHRLANRVLSQWILLSERRWTDEQRDELELLLTGDPRGLALVNPDDPLSYPAYLAWIWDHWERHSGNPLLGNLVHQAVTPLECGRALELLLLDIASSDPDRSIIAENARAYGLRWARSNG